MISSAKMDEDTLIALGFVVGAALLVAITFVWVIVYCLCCRLVSQAHVQALLLSLGLG